MKRIFTIIFVLTSIFAHSQWTTDTAVNTLVADSGALDMQAKVTSESETYVVFWKEVGAPINIELRMQVLDVDGNQTLGADGILVSDQIPMSSFTVQWNMVVDADDNVYIGVTGTGGGAPAFVFKLDTDGNQLWGSNGVNVGSGYSVTVLPLSQGGAIVQWDTSMQKYDASGNAVWANPVTVTSGSTAATAPSNLFEISNDNIIVVFHERFRYGVNSNLFAQRYNTDGVSQWANALKLSDRATAFNRPNFGVQDGDVVYMSYFAALGNRFDAFVQRINPDGTLPWGINGSDFDINETNFEKNINIAFEPGDENVWAICEYTSADQNQSGEYVQKFNKDTGARLLTDNAKEVFPIGSEKIHSGILNLNNGTPFFLMKEGFDNGVTPTTLNLVYLDENGDFAWTDQSKPVATFVGNKSRIQFPKQNNDQFVTVFVEDKGAGAKIYAQNYVECVLSISCPADITVSTDAGTCTASGITLDPPTTNNCADETITNDAPAEFAIGETIVTWTVDNGSTTLTCTQIVTVEDTTAPEITCVEDQEVEVVTGMQYTLPDYFATGEATATDNCTNPVVNTSQNPTAGTELAAGVHTIELTAEDEYGNESTCVFEVTVNEVLSVNDQALSSESISMFPNPANDQITIGNLNGLKLTSAIIYDMLGRTIKTVDLTDMESNKTIDISGLTKAIYLVLIQSEQSQITKQLVKR